MVTNTNTGGGAATHAGTNYQNRVAAWTAVQILAEQDVTPPWGLPGTVTLETLHAEAPNPIDDLVVHTSAGGKAFAQAKHTVGLDTTPTSPLGSTITQFVKEFCAVNQAFDPRKDRFVLVTSPQSSAGIKTDLTRFLARMHTSPDPDAEWTAGNQDEQRAASVLRDHITREWQANKRTPPTTTDIAALLRLAYVHILDVDPGGQAETEAKNTLRQRILTNPTTADAAWNTLIATAGTYAANHQQADRLALQRALTDAAIDIQAQRTYRGDIDRLKQHTATTLQTLTDFSHIAVGATIVTIQRAPATAARTAAHDGHLLILGTPGAGKSGALYDATNTLIAQGADVVLFAVDQLEAASSGSLRNELGLTHELTIILNAWPGTNPAYLIIDALDAARTDGAVRTVHTLMEQVIASNNRWHVFASVRKFDLRYNHQLQRLFHGTPPTNYTDNEFPSTRHVNIPPLTDAELAQVATQSPPLAALIANAPALLQELLRVPFNLRLLAELLGNGVNPNDLQPLQTQVELLDRYWHERIIRHDGQGDTRELILHRTTDAMVQHRALRTPRTAAVGNDAASSKVLAALLSSHVLAEWTTKTGTTQREFITFPHHLLFDYAVARLSLAHEHGPFIARLTTEPDLLIAIRPSVELYFQRLWHDDQTAFWNLTFAILDSVIPEVGKLIGPSVAALHATNDQQTQPLRDYLTDPARYAKGIAALQHILSTLLTHATTTNTIPTGPWIEFLDTITTALTPSLTNTVRPYTVFLSDHAEQLAGPDRQRLGTIARRLLTYYRDVAPSDRFLAVGSITAVINTLTTDPVASITILRGCITKDHLTTHGHQILSTIARHVLALAAVDTAFTRDLYIAAFRYHDESKDTTTIGDSQILPMTSTKKQDYDLGLWQLGEHFPRVLQAAPVDAIDALLTIVTEYVHAERHPADTPDQLQIDGIQTSCLQDYSSIWDEGLSSQHDNPIRMLNAFQTFLEHTTDPQGIRAYLSQIAAHQPPAVIWRRLITAGTNQPTTIGQAIRSLAWDHNILVAYDTTRPIGQLLRAIYPALAADERERIEDAIMNIPVREPAHLTAANAARDRLLGCLDPALLVTAAARQRRDTLSQQGGPPSNDEDDTAAHWGTLKPAHLAADAAHADLFNAVTGFASQHLNGTPPPDAIAAILPTISDFYTAITTDNLTPEVENTAFNEIARCTVSIGRRNDLTADQAALLLPIILRATTQPSPAPQAGDDQERPVTGWGNAARIAAAEAITILARHTSCCTPQALAAIQRLSNDPVPSVRLQVASHVLCLYETAPGLMWDLLEHYASNEQNPSVINDALQALRRLPVAHATRTAALTIRVLNRTTHGASQHDVHEGCVNILCALTLWANEPQSTAAIDHLIADPSTHARDIQRLIMDLAGTIPAKDPTVTVRAFALLHRTLDSVITAMRAIDAQYQGVAWPPDAQEIYRGLFQAADEAAQRLYFASGAFKNSDKERVLLARDVFYLHARPLFVLLAEIGHPHTAHNLLETLKYFVRVDPAGILQLVSATVKMGSKYGYQYEPLAEGLMVDIVEQYLAEYRPLFRDHPECHTALMTILDVFVRVGWPRAHQLTYQLGDIYR